MPYVVYAKPIQWETNGPCQNGVQNWFDGDYGFTIDYDPEEERDSRYSIAWGESEYEAFEFLEVAQARCQDIVDAWIRQFAVVVEE